MPSIPWIGLEGVGVVDARVWLGIHFRTADVDSMVLARKVTHWLDKHYFREDRDAPGDRHHWLGSTSGM